MRINKTIFFAILACLAFVPGARGRLRWRNAVPVNVGHYNYEFTALDCWHNVCIVAAIRRDLSLPNDSDFWVLFLFRSTDAGETWTQQDPGLPHSKGSNNNYIRYVQQIDSLDAVAMSDSGVVVVTTNGGNTWLRRDLPIKDYDQKGFHFSNPMTGIVTLWSNLPNNIYTTSDGGITWNRAPWYPWLTTTMCHSDGGERFRAITAWNGPLYFTSDNWATVDSTSLIVPYGGSGDTESVWGCNFRGDTLVAFGVHQGQQSKGPLIAISTDNGVTWSYLPLPPTFGSAINCISSLDRGVVFAGASFGERHLYKSTDHGLSWTTDTMIYSSDTTEVETDAIAVTTSGNAIAILGLSPSVIGTELMVGEPSNDVVKDSSPFELSLVVYPNPASQTISIESLESGKQAHVLDVLGREVLCGTVPAAGPLTLDVSSLPAGLYYVSDCRSRAKFVKE